MNINEIDIKVKSVKIIHDRNSGNPMGYGFLEFENKTKAKEALNSLNGKPLPKTENKAFKLNWAVYNNNKLYSQNPNEFSIYVCELEPSVNDETLTKFFKEKYASVISSKIIVDPSTKISKGYGFVKFSNKILGSLYSFVSINVSPWYNDTSYFEIPDSISYIKFNGNDTNILLVVLTKVTYKNNEKKNTNMYDFSSFQNFQNDPNLFQQQYLNQFYMANGYGNLNMNPFIPQFYSQFMQSLQNQNMFNPNMMNFNISPELAQPINNQQNQRQDLNQLFGNLELLQNKGNNNFESENGE